MQAPMNGYFYFSNVLFYVEYYILYILICFIYVDTSKSSQTCIVKKLHLYIKNVLLHQTYLLILFSMNFLSSLVLSFCH